MKKIAADRNYKKAFRLQKEAATTAEAQGATDDQLHDLQGRARILDDRLNKVERILMELKTWKSTVGAALEAQYEKDRSR